MSEAIKPGAELSAAIVEVLGIVVILGFALYALAYAAVQLRRRDSRDAVFRDARQRLGRGILLGLEFLIAADIIHTVAVRLSYESVTVLGIIVLIRTFLSFTLEVELTGAWPWQQTERAGRA